MMPMSADAAPPRYMCAAHEDEFYDAMPAESVGEML